METNNHNIGKLSALLEVGALTEGLKQAEQQVRQAPAQAELRYGLFQLLCIRGDWQRAVQQLQLCARLDASYNEQAQLFGELIRSEVYRARVFNGEQRPDVLLPAPEWLESLLAALTCDAQAQIVQADTLRYAALQAASDVAGRWDAGVFKWISDSDSRLGQVLELFAGGRYCWLPFSQIHTLSSDLPVQLTDLLWKPATLTLVNGDSYPIWMFVRYPGSERGSDALQLCRETLWQDGPGETRVCALGQKVWLSDSGDINLLSLKKCVFNSRPEDIS